MTMLEKNENIINILFIDNFDSFSFNVVDDLKQTGCNVTVVRNDVSLDVFEQFITQKDITHIVISPGPGTPEDAGICIEVINRYRSLIPIFGICLGFQAMVIACGGKVSQIENPCHGKSSDISYKACVLLDDLPNPFRAGRYHSLGAKEITEQLTVTATTDDVPMAIENTDELLFAVQFHPESILTPTGNKILLNFINQAFNENNG